LPKTTQSVATLLEALRKLLKGTHGFFIELLFGRKLGCEKPIFKDEPNVDKG
jgi:hypothetical protein